MLDFQSKVRTESFRMRKCHFLESIGYQNIRVWNSQNWWPIGFCNVVKQRKYLVQLLWFWICDEVTENVWQTINGWWIRNGFERMIKRFPSAKQVKAAVVIEFYFTMILIGHKFIIFRDHFDILMNSMTMLETESKIIWVILMILLNCALIILHHKQQSFVNVNDTFQANIKTVLCGSSFNLIEKW
jgi:hypothetical protein